MIPVVNKDFELEKKSDGIEDSQAEDGVLEHAVASFSFEKFPNSRVPDEARDSLMELDPGARESGFDAKMLENGRSMEFNASSSEDGRFLVSSDAEGGGADVEMKFSGSLVHAENSTVDRFDGQVGQFDGSNGQKNTLTQYKSLLTEFDDYVENDKSGAMVAAAASRAMSYGFEVGDMVWGKVKSHPWWPGHIFNDALASPSVRRTRREGYVLVAFFGDSSYGWFDPAELVPFDPNYYEKSRQTNSRTFLKAVEEAVDEASRRRGLGLVCKCRNRYNFRHTNVEGYFAVDVPDFEAGGIYAWNQIRRSRENFKPTETLSFIKQLALTPRGGDHRSINFLNNKATIFAYRKAVYEEFDETYAQAFGVLPGRSPRDTVAAFEHFRGPARAPLSGPLVIAEALGGGKSVIKPMKLKDQSKKDRYLFKRREEPSNLKDIEIQQERAISTVPSSLVGGSTDTEGAGDYVLLKRTPTVPVKPQILAKSDHGGFSDRDSETSSLVIPRIEDEIGQVPVGSNIVSQGHSLGVEASYEKEMVPLGEMKETVTPGEVVSSSDNACPDNMAREMSSPSMLDSESLCDKANGNSVGEVRCAETANMLKSSESIQQPELSNLMNLEGDCMLHVVPETSSAGAKYSDGDSTVGGVIKPKVLKRPADELSSGILFTGVKKKKKKKRDAGAEASSDHVQKQLASKKVGSIVGKLAGKSNQVGSGYKEDFRVEYQKKVNASGSSISHSGMLPVFGRGNDEFDVPQLLSNLQAFALDPFHGIETNCHAIVQKFFLRFRSRVYQKSLVLSPLSEAESIEVRAAKSSDVSLGTDNSSEHVRDLTSSNTVKPLLRRDDPTKAGRKRVPSDRLEEIAAKKLKKVSDLKLLASEKKSTQKLSDTQRRESKESALPTAVKVVKRDPVKKLEPSVRKVDPTMLILKFPPQTSLPSLNELKARFGRFGPIDQTGLRIFWKSLTCRVVFLYKPDAQAAYKYAAGNKSLFGNVNVKYYLHDVEAPATEASELEKGGGDDNPSEAPRLKDPTVLQGRASTPTHQPLPQLPVVQLKSCLKKSSGEDSGVPGGGSVGGSSKGTTRVKFMLGGEESSKGEQLMMIGNRNNINANFADGGTPSVAMDINSNYFQKVIPPSPLPILPLPTQFTKPPHTTITSTTNMHHLEIPPRNTLNHNSISATLSGSSTSGNPSPSATSTDISQQMLSLLTRCSDVVTNVTGLLGYVPYHPL